MKKKIVNGLSQVQLMHWLNAARQGKPLTETDPESNEVVVIPYPLGRSDGNGLTFTLSKSGTATWVLRYRHANRSRELTLGNFPDLGLSDARRMAREKRVEIDQGGDPAQDKKKKKILILKDWTVSQLVDDYKEKILVSLSSSTQRSYGRALKRISNKLGTSFVTKVEALDIVCMIEDVKATWTESCMLLTTVKMLFRHAVGKRLVISNPCIGIELNAVMGRRPAVRKRIMLEEEELKQILNASMSDENKLAIKILLATAVRTDELRNAKWEHLDFSKKIWSVPSSKTGRAIQIPLTEPVIQWFLRLKELANESVFVLPARKERRKKRFGGDAAINPNTIGAAIEFWLNEHKPSVRRFTPHDFRSTAKSYLRKLGVDRDVTEMCLNHKLKGIEGIYDVHTYFDERREALNRWSDYLIAIQNGLGNKKQNPFLVAQRMLKNN